MTTNKSIDQHLQTVDPIVTRIKFERELSAFKNAEKIQRQRGVILLRSEFPHIVLAFSPVRLKPRVIALAIRLDFTNYDLEAPSLKFVDPLTEVELLSDQLDAPLLREVAPGQILPGPIPIHVEPQIQNLIQFHKSDQVPFVCLPGIHEYHNHPAHSNDSWLLHRSQGEGTLGFIIDQLCKYGSEPIVAYNPEMTFKVNGAGQVNINLGKVSFAHNKIPK